MHAGDHVIDLRDPGDAAVLPAASPVAARPAEHAAGDTLAELAVAARLRDLRGIGVALLIVLNALDIVTTAAALDAGAVEANPLSALLITEGWMGYAKAAVLLALGLRVLRGRPRLGPTCALWFVVGVYAAVIAVNTLALRQLGVL